MTDAERIASLEARVKDLEKDIELVYDALDKRIDDMQARQSDRLTLWGIFVALLIGALQIGVSFLLKFWH